MKFIKILNNFEEIFISSLMAVATAVIFVSIVHRYLAGLPIPYVQDWMLELNFSWAQEFCIYAFVWTAKFGAAYGVRTGIHVGVDVLVKRFDSSLQKKFISFALLSGAVFTSIIAWLGGTFVWDNGAHYAFYHFLGLDTGAVPQGPVTPDLEWPTWIVYSAIPLGSALMCFRFLEVLVNFVRTGELPHHDHAHVEGVEVLSDSLENDPDLAAAEEAMK